MVVSSSGRSARNRACSHHPLRRDRWLYRCHVPNFRPFSRGSTLPSGVGASAMITGPRHDRHRCRQSGTAAAPCAPSAHRADHCRSVRRRRSRNRTGSGGRSHGGVDRVIAAEIVDRLPSRSIPILSSAGGLRAMTAPPPRRVAMKTRCGGIVTISDCQSTDVNIDPGNAAPG